MIELAAIIVIAVLCVILFLRKPKDRKTILAEEENKELLRQLNEAQEELGIERDRNKALLSQKKSSETRLGQISEHLVPFLEGCRHDPKNMHFMGNPIDYLAFDFDQGSITFLEVKSGNSKPSKRQKIIKNIIKTGRVYYEEIRINQHGVKSKVIGPQDAKQLAEQLKNGLLAVDDENEDDNE